MICLHGTTELQRKVWVWQKVWSLLFYERDTDAWSHLTPYSAAAQPCFHPWLTRVISWLLLLSFIVKSSLISGVELAFAAVWLQPLICEGAQFLLPVPVWGQANTSTNINGPFFLLYFSPCKCKHFQTTEICSVCLSAESWKVWILIPFWFFKVRSIFIRAKWGNWCKIHNVCR